MRITKEALLKAAREFAERYARRNRELVCIYLTGSLLTESPLLGGATDIDLVFVHTSTPAFPREIVRLSDEVHLDIAHYSQALFQKPRLLREDPWLGSFLVAGPLVLFDAGHWFEFTQAGAGSQFNNPEYILHRAQKLAGSARSSWAELSASPPQDTPAQTGQYLTCLENAANGIALLSGPPLTERRFMLQFPDRAQAVGKPGLSAGLNGLFQGNEIQAGTLRAWFPEWSAALQNVAHKTDAPVRLDGARRAYFENAVDLLIEDHPDAALWLLLRTWTEAAACLTPAEEGYQSWQSACRDLSLSGADFTQRCAALDAYLDSVEETLDLYSQQYGV